MDAIDAITARRSIRAFKPDPVPRAALEGVLETVRYAPSWGNTQSWQFTVLGGGQLEEIRQALEAKERAGVPPTPDLPWPAFTGSYAVRRRELGLSMREKMDVSGDDGDASRRLAISNIRFFEAPNAVIATVHKRATPYALVDLGIAFQTMALAAHHYGLGTCIQAKVITYPGVLREALLVPEDRLIAPVFFDNLMKGIRAIHQYQFLQKAKREIILSVVPCEGFCDDTRTRLATIQDEVQRRSSLP